MADAGRTADALRHPRPDDAAAFLAAAFRCRDSRPAADKESTIGCAVPTPLARQFLDDVADGRERLGARHHAPRLDGIPKLGLAWQKLENAALKASLRVPEGTTGCCWREGLSLNRAIVRLLEETKGGERQQLDHLAGRWSEQEYQTEWFPRLRDATPEQRGHWDRIGPGFGVRWPEIDEDISVAGLLGLPGQTRAGRAVRYERR